MRWKSCASLHLLVVGLLGAAPLAHAADEPMPDGPAALPPNQASPDVPTAEDEAAKAPGPERTAPAAAEDEPSPALANPETNAGEATDPAVTPVEPSKPASAAPLPPPEPPPAAPPARVVPSFPPQPPPFLYAPGPGPLKPTAPPIPRIEGIPEGAILQPVPPPPGAGMRAVMAFRIQADVYGIYATLYGYPLFPQLLGRIELLKPRVHSLTVRCARDPRLEPLSLQARDQVLALEASLANPDRDMLMTQLAALQQTLAQLQQALQANRLPSQE